MDAIRPSMPSECRGVWEKAARRLPCIAPPPTQINTCSLMEDDAPGMPTMTTPPPAQPPAYLVLPSLVCKPFRHPPAPAPCLLSPAPPPPRFVSTALATLAHRLRRRRNPDENLGSALTFLLGFYFDFCFSFCLAFCLTYCLASAWLLLGFCMASCWLLPDFCLISAWLLLGL